MVEPLPRTHPETVDDLSSSQEQALRRYLDALRGVFVKPKDRLPFDRPRPSSTTPWAGLIDSLVRFKVKLPHSVLQQLQLMVVTYQDHRACL